MYRLEPIVALRNCDVIGHELLAGEESCPVLDEGQWRQWYRWLAASVLPGLLRDHQGLFFVNVSSAQVMDRAVCRALASLGSRRRIVLEWTEDHCHGVSPRDVAHVLHGFREAGFLLAVDDVGAGVDGIGRAAAIRPDFAKIDGPLLHRARVEGSGVLRGVQAALVATGADVVVEWVETDADLRMALAAGVRLGQGRLFRDLGEGGKIQCG